MKPIRVNERSSCEIIGVRGPVWENEEQTRIKCLIKNSCFTKEQPYSASKDDIELSGQEIFKMCKDRAFGVVGPYNENLQKDSQKLALIKNKYSDRIGNVSLRYNPENLDKIDDSFWVLNKFVEDANGAMHEPSIRGVGLIWGEMLRDMLDRYIHSRGYRSGKYGLTKKKLKYKNKKECGDNFESRINGAFSNKFICENTQGHLHAIREIRNACAHEWDLSIENDKMKNLIEHFNTLKCYKKIFIIKDNISSDKYFNDLMVHVYVSACSYIMFDFINKSEST